MSLRETPMARRYWRRVGGTIAEQFPALPDARSHGTTERRLREAYKAVRMLIDAYDSKTARAWLFGTNTRLDDRAPIEVLGAATETAEFAAVVRAARQVASFQA
ncbi:MAG: XRE family transcriptional regulator [Solirubrobacteraceae bacterium]